MSREEAQQLILEKLDEVQQILDRYDPKHGSDYLTATIMKNWKGDVIIRFNNDCWHGVQKPIDFAEDMPEDGVDLEKRRKLLLSSPYGRIVRE